MGEISDIVDVVLKAAPEKRDRRYILLGIALGFVLALVPITVMLVNAFKAPNPPPVTVNIQNIYPPQNHSLRGRENDSLAKADDSSISQNADDLQNKPENISPQIERAPSKKVEIDPRPGTNNTQPRKGKINARKEPEKNRLEAEQENSRERCPGSSIARVCAPQYDSPYEPPQWAPPKSAFKDVPWLNNPKFDFHPNGFTFHF